MLSAVRRTSVALVTLAALIAGCSKRETTSDTTRAQDSAMAATSTAASAPTPAAPAMTDANIFAVLDAANAADSSDGSVAATKGTSADVKAFGREMVKDHHALRADGQALAKKLNVTPEMPAGDNSATAAAAWHDSLVAMPKGAAFDKAYIDHEVTAHEQVLQKAQASEAAAQNAELKAMIPKAAAKVQEHLDRAKQVQSKLASAK
jgi:putative membrane protein